MNRKLWDLYAPIYKRAMKANQHIYEFLKAGFDHICSRLIMPFTYACVGRKTGVY